MKNKKILLVYLLLIAGGLCANAEDVIIGNLKYDLYNNGIAEVTGLANTSITSVEIPASITTSDGKIYNVKKVAGSAFYNCSNIQSVTLGNKIESIDRYAFAGCTSLADINLNDNITSIAESAFRDCTSLTEIVLGESILEMGGDVFSDCTNLRSVDIHDGAMVIGSRAFWGCKKLTSITIPNSVLTIGDGAFSECTSLKDATIGNAVQSIPNGMFNGCTRLQNVKLGKGTTSVGALAFNDCPLLEYVTVASITPPTICIVDFNNTFSSYNAILRVPVQSMDDYTTAEGWENFSNIEGYNSDDDDVPDYVDVNGDGSINSADVVAIYNYIIYNVDPRK